MHDWVVIVHAGAGRHSLSLLDKYKIAMDNACKSAGEILSSSGSSLDAVVSALSVLEDDPITNAGTGSALNRDGHVEMDCSVMEGSTGRFGAVGAISNVYNPSAVAHHLLVSSSTPLSLGRIPPM